MLNVLASILPGRRSTPAAPLPEVGAAAPTSLGPIHFGTAPQASEDVAVVHGSSTPATGDDAPAPTLVAFVRHCGCPFAEKEVKMLAQEVAKNQSLRVVIVQHSPEKETKEWFDSLGGVGLFSDPSRLTLLSDPSRALYAAWGVGLLGWGGMVNGSVMSSLKALKESENIDLRPTGKGSWRWQNSGGFAVSRDGKVQWRKVAQQSSDMCDYAEAAKTIA